MEQQGQGQHGIEAILAALNLGGQPLGNLGQVPVGVNPSQSSANPVAQGNMESQQQGTANPAAAATSPVDGEMVKMILQALMGQGAGGFNAEGNQVG